MAARARAAPALRLGRVSVRTAAVNATVSLAAKAAAEEPEFEGEVLDSCGGASSPPVSRMLFSFRLLHIRSLKFVQTLGGLSYASSYYPGSAEAREINNGAVNCHNAHSAPRVNGTAEDAKEEECVRLYPTDRQTPSFIDMQQLAACVPKLESLDLLEGYHCSEDWPRDSHRIDLGSHFLLGLRIRRNPNRVRYWSHGELEMVRSARYRKLIIINNRYFSEHYLRNFK